MANGAQVVKEGFLIKRGHRRHNWKIRWFKLSETSLRYYKDQTSNVPLGRIPLTRATLRKATTSESEEAKEKTRENVFIVTTSNGTKYPIQTASSAEFETWMKDIEHIITRLQKSKRGTLRLPSSTQLIYGDENSNSGNERHHVDMFIETWLSQSFHGLRHDEVVSGLELRQWTERALRIPHTDAEDTVKALVRIGIIDCVTSDLDINLHDNSQYFRLDIDRSTAKKKIARAYLTSATVHNECSSYSGSTKTSHCPSLPDDLPSGNVVKSGILFKRGHIIPSWKARCFILQDSPSTLSYYDPAKKSLKTINSLQLDGATVFPVTKKTAEAGLKISNPPEHLFCVQLSTRELYLITASSGREKSEWIEAIHTQCRKNAKK